MATYKPCLTIDVIVIPGPTHPLPKKPQKFLPKYDPDDDVLPEHHIKQFMDALKLMNAEHEDVVCRLFPHTLQGKATKWFFNLAPGSITSWKKFEVAFMAKFSDEETPRILSLELLGIRMNENEKLKISMKDLFHSSIESLSSLPRQFKLNIMFLLYHQTLL